MVLSTNAARATRPLSVIAINQADANRQFFGATIRRLQGAEGLPEESVDAEHGRIYALDAGPGRIGARELRDDGLQLTVS